MLDTLSSSQRAVVAAQEALQRLGAEEAPGRLSWAARVHQARNWERQTGTREGGHKESM